MPVQKRKPAVSKKRAKRTRPKMEYSWESAISRFPSIRKRIKNHNVHVRAHGCLAYWRPGNLWLEKQLNGQVHAATNQLALHNKADGHDRSLVISEGTACHCFFLALKGNICTETMVANILFGREKVWFCIVYVKNLCNTNVAANFVWRETNWRCFWRKMSQSNNHLKRFHWNFKNTNFCLRYRIFWITNNFAKKS
jgi:hypothetical protein